MKRARNPRRYPITRRNSTALGYDARGKTWERWWRDARWDKAVPTPGVSESACLNVPCPDWHGEFRIRDRAWYRVRPKREGKRRAVRIKGVWHWEYWP
jgi:hypothetical protein